MPHQHSVGELKAETNFDKWDKMWGFYKHLMKCKDYFSKRHKM